MTLRNTVTTAALAGAAFGLLAALSIAVAEAAPVRYVVEPNHTFVNFEVKHFRVAARAGELTLLGKTQPVRLDASNFNCYDSPIVKGRVCGGDFEATIERSRWGMIWGIDHGVPDRVRLVIQIEAVAQP